MQPGTPQLVTCPYCGKEKKLMTSITENIPFIAEVYRELGKFDNCISTLENFETDNDYIRLIVNGIREKAHMNDNKVFEIDHSGEKTTIVL